MKVCLVSFFAYPLFNPKYGVIFGGAEVQLFNLSQELSSDHEVSFIVGDFGQNIFESYNGINVISSVVLGEKYGFLKKIKSAIIQIIAMRKSGADIFIKRAAGPEVGIIAFYCKLFHKKFIYMTAHEIDCSGEYKRKNWLLGLLYEFGLKHADIVITQNTDHKKMLMDNYDIDADILPSGYDIPQMRTEAGDYILWVARLDDWKQPEIFIKLARLFPNENFVMVAPFSGDKDYAEKIKIDAEKIKNIKFIPGVNFSGIDQYFKFAKLFVNTSRYEGFPNTFVQAAMHGVPIISLNVNPDNLIEKNNIGFCANNDFMEMKKYTELLLKDQGMYNTVSANAYKYAKKNHDIQEVYSKFINILKKL